MSSKSLQLPPAIEVSSCLQDTLNYLSGYYHIDADEEKYSKIAFLLLKLEGDKSVIQEIAEYIQMQHSDIKFEKNKTWKMANRFLSVFNWAASYIRSKENK